MDVLVESLRHRWPVVSLLAELVYWLVTFIDETNLFLLLVLAALVRNVGEITTSRQDSGKAKYVTLLFAGIYGVHLWPGLDFTTDVIGVVAAIIRTIFACVIVHHVLSIPAVAVSAFVLRYLESSWQSMAQETKKLEHEVKQIREERFKRRNPEPPPLPREEIIQRRTDQAKLDYDFECQILQDADLDDHERNAAFDAAKQKYLRRISETIL